MGRRQRAPRRLVPLRTRRPLSAAVTAGRVPLPGRTPAGGNFPQRRENGSVSLSASPREDKRGKLYNLQRGSHFVNAAGH